MARAAKKTANARARKRRAAARALRAPQGAQVALVAFEEEALPRGRRSDVKQVVQESLTHQLEHELESTREELQSTIEELESAGIVTLFLGADRTIKRFTPSAADVFKVIATDVGRPIGDVVARFEDPDLAGDIDAVLRQLSSREKDVLAENGRWYLRRITPYRTLDNRIEGVVLAFHDVTPLKLGQEELRKLSGQLEQRVAQRTAELQAEVRERASAEEALHEERNFVNAILDTAGALVLVLDTEGRVVRFNKACEEASGLSAEEIRDKRNWEVLVPPEEREAVKQVFESLGAGRYPGRYENHWQRPDGSRRLIAWSNTALLDPSGAVQYVVATGVDITERRRAEHELLVRESEVARLHRLQAMGALTALLAHELNQPLAAIASYAEASAGQLEKGEAGDKLKRNLQQIVQQAQRASRTIQELDQFLAKTEPQKTIADLAGVLRAACGLVERVAAARGIRLECGTGAGLPRVMAQPMQLEHVMVNLLQNALDAVAGSGRTGGAVTVHVKTEGKDRVRIEVQDNGPGLDAPFVETVFEPLYTTKNDGLGLGLSICRSIVEAHGGKIWAEPGPGGKFYVTLPVAP